MVEVHKRDGNCKVVQFVGGNLEDLLANVRIFVDMLGHELTQLVHTTEYAENGTMINIIYVFYYFEYDGFEEFDPLEEEVKVNNLLNIRYNKMEPSF
jgi:hypothetical protein